MTANQTTLDYLRSLADQGFWGAITLKYEHGEVIHLRKEENLKPSSLSELPRLANAKPAH
jgi:hypothetical protein